MSNLIGYVFVFLALLCLAPVIILFGFEALVVVQGLIDPPKQKLVSMGDSSNGYQDGSDDSTGSGEAKFEEVVAERASAIDHNRLQKRPA